VDFVPLLYAQRDIIAITAYTFTQED